MKRCPYCAEEIQDAALKCRWCGSDLTAAPDRIVADPPPELAERVASAQTAATAGTRSGHAGAPKAAEAATPQAAEAATPQAEPAAQPEEVYRQATAPQAAVEQPASTAPTAQPGAGAAGRAPEILSPPRTPSPSPNLTFSHEGARYILGYTQQYYGIWDKQSPGPPAERFARTDQGWQQAWEAFIRREMATA